MEKNSTNPFTSGTFKFTYDGARVAKEDTPAGVSNSPVLSVANFLHDYWKMGMEDGDQIDAFLEQVCRPILRRAYTCSIRIISPGWRKPVFADRIIKSFFSPSIIS